MQQNSLKPKEVRDFRSLPSPILVLGAAYSGKSNLAQECILEPQMNTLVIGTADPEETSLQERIQSLQARRPEHWHQIDANSEIIATIESRTGLFGQILIDSLNQWLGSEIVRGLAKYSEEQLRDHLRVECDALVRFVEDSRQHSNRLVLVSTEVGASLSPALPAAKLFREWTSRLNCLVAAHCRSVILVSAGIPLVLKKEHG